MDEESTKEDSELKDDKKDAIDFLLKHEKDDAESCLEIHEKDEECLEEFDSDEDDHEELPIMRSNPCATPSGSTRHPVLATKVAYQMHHKAKTQLRNRGGRKALKADATQGEYMSSGKSVELKEICKITAKHSNDSRRDGEPCTGKDNPGVRFKIGKDWENVKENVKTSYKEVYLPPRREHICTSNLENLDVGSVTKGGKAIHSLLGDVMLAANKQAERIKSDFSGKSDDQSACRAVRNSFADLGDIIRGKDLWDHKDQTTLQNHLKSVFKNIKENVPGIKGKYDGDDNNNPPYKKLREDWWEANRSQVWDAMKCHIEHLNDTSVHTSSSNHCGYSKHIPPDDYIPQRLRWLTEWAEWFCKMQSKEYEKLEKKCAGCMNKNKNGGKGCMQNDGECDECKEACEAYKKEIEKWQRQWNNMQVPYITLYEQARTVRDGTGFYNPNDQQMVHFFKELQEANKSSTSKRPKRSLPRDTSTPYSTAEGYIHQELPNVGCNTQTEFCDKKKW